MVGLLGFRALMPHPRGIVRLAVPGTIRSARVVPHHCEVAAGLPYGAPVVGHPQSIHIAGRLNRRSKRQETAIARTRKAHANQVPVRWRFPGIVPGGARVVTDPELVTHGNP